MDYCCFEILIAGRFLNGKDIIQRRLLERVDLARVALSAAVLPHHPASQALRGPVTLLRAHIGFSLAFRV